MIAAILALSTTVIAAPAASAAPWPCDGTGYVTMHGGTVGNKTLLSKVVPQPGGYSVSPIHEQPGELINAVAFRVQDGFMYAWRNQPAPPGLVRIESNGAGGATIVPQPPIAGVPPTFGAFVGTFLSDGRYFVFGTPSNPIGYVIDVTGPAPTLVTEVTPDWDASAAGLPIGDVAVSPVDGNIYATLGGKVRRLTLSGSTLELGPEVGTGGPASPGAQWFSPVGTQSTLLQISSHPDGLTHLYATDMATGVLTDLGPLDQNIPNGDGTGCANTVAVTKDATPRTVIAGEQLTYAYTITSHGQVDNPIDFVDTLPPGMTYVPGGVTVNGTFGPTNAYGNTDTLTISGTIPHNTTVTITARVQVASTAACNAEVPNQAQATMHSSSGLPDVTILSDDPSTPTDLGDPTTVQVNCEADVEIEKSSAARIVPGKPATYTLKVTNNGPSAATNATASDPLPEGVSFASASSGCSENAGKVTCSVASLAVGASQTFEVNVKVAGAAKCSQLENAATVTSAVFDPNEGNNSSSVRNCGPESDLEISKTPSSAKVSANGQVAYTLVVKNKGPSDNSNVTVSDTLAAGLALESAKPSQGSCSTAGGKVACKLGTLAAGGSAQVLVTAKMTSSDCVKNTAKVIGDGFDPRQSNNRDEAEVCPRPEPPSLYDLVVKKTANKKRVLADGNVRYTIMVTNNGPDTAPGVQLTDTFNHKAILVAVKTTAGSCGKALPLSCSLGDLPSGGNATITAVLKPLTIGCGQRNVASATGEGTDTNPANNLSRVDICVAPKLGIVKTVDRDSVKAGDIVKYTIRVTNLSKRIAAEKVRTCDRLPSGLAFVGSKPKAKLSKGMPCWTKAVLKGGKSVAYRVTARALRGAAGRQRNVATATAQGSRNKAVSDDALVRVRARAPRPTPVTG